MLAYRRLVIAPASDPARRRRRNRPPRHSRSSGSPDGSRLAYITLSDAQGALRCVVVDMKSRRSRIALDFIPSSEQRTLFQFFDQYAYSHSPWSPDSANLVFAGHTRWRRGVGIPSRATQFPPNRATERQPNHRSKRRRRIRPSNHSRWHNGILVAPLNRLSPR